MAATKPFLPSAALLRALLLLLPALLLPHLPPFPPTRPSLSALLPRLSPAHAPPSHLTTLTRRNTAFANPWREWRGTASLREIAQLVATRDYLRALLPVGAAELVGAVDGGDGFWEGRVGMVWLGHGGAVVRQGEMVYLVDPVLAGYVGLGWWARSRRVGDAPFGGSWERVREKLALERLDFVLLTHAHYDHLSVVDLAEIERLWRPLYFVPEGVERYLGERPLGVEKGRIVGRVWWERGEYCGKEGVGRCASVTLTPAMHSSRRGLFDDGAALHGGWVVKSGGTAVYVLGDSGYVEGLFGEIGQRLGPFDLSLIPIGAYAPRDLHRASHMDPEHALRVHGEVRSRFSVAVHWGAFRLTVEPVLEPRDLLREAVRRARAEGKGVDETRFECVLPGEVVSLPA